MLFKPVSITHFRVIFENDPFSHSTTQMHVTSENLVLSASHVFNSVQRMLSPTQHALLQSYQELLQQKKQQMFQHQVENAIKELDKDVCNNFCLFFDI